MFKALQDVLRTGTYPSGLQGSALFRMSHGNPVQVSGVAYYDQPLSSANLGTLDRGVRYGYSEGRLSSMSLESDPSEFFQNFTHYPYTYKMKDWVSTFSSAGAESSRVEYVYDSNTGHLSKVKQELPGSTWAEWVFAKDNQGYTTSLTDPHASRKTSYVHDDLGKLVQMTSPDSGVTLFVYDARGTLTEKVEALGKTEAQGKRNVTYVPDVLGRVVLETAHTTVSGQSDQTVTYTYDDPAVSYSAGRLTKVVDSSGTSSFEYDSSGRLFKETRETTGLAGSVTLQYGYNTNSTLASVTLVENAGSSSRSYKVSYKPAATQDAKWDPDRAETVELEYGSPAATKTLASGVKWRPFLDEVSSLTLGNALQYTRTFTADGYAKTERLTQSGTDVMAWTYGTDYAGRLTSASVTGLQVGRPYASVKYDKLGRLKESQPPSPVTGQTGKVSYTYDHTGNRKQVDYDFKYVTGAYQPLSDEYLYPASSPDDCTSPVAPDVAKSSRLCRVKVYAPASGGSPAWSAGPDLETAYQALLEHISNIIEQAEPGELFERLQMAKESIDLFCEEQGIPRMIFFRALQDDEDVRAKVVDILTEQEQQNIPGHLDALIERAGALNLGTLLSGYTNGLVMTFHWDSAGRLISEGHEKLVGSQTQEVIDLCYGHDLWGRLNKVSVPKSQSASDPCAENNLAPLRESKYDFRGRRSFSKTVMWFESFYYDQRGRLVAAAGPGDQSPDGGGSGPYLSLGRQYVYLGNRLLAELVLSQTDEPFWCSLSGAPRLAGALAALLWMVGVPGVFIFVVRRRRPGARGKVLAGLLCVVLMAPAAALLWSCASSAIPTPTAQYYHTDHMGLPVALTDEQGAVLWQATYEDFGEVDKQHKGTPSLSLPSFRFPGQTDDADRMIIGATGPYYNLHRYYDPLTGRYMSPDPDHQAGQFNTYHYVAGDPLNAFDPDGKQVDVGPCSDAEDREKCLRELYNKCRNKLVCNVNRGSAEQMMSTVTTSPLGGRVVALVLRVALLVCTAYQLYEADKKKEKCTLIGSGGKGPKPGAKRKCTYYCRPSGEKIDRYYEDCPYEIEAYPE